MGIVGRLRKIVLVMAVYDRLHACMGNSQDTKDRFDWKMVECDQGRT